MLQRNNFYLIVFIISIIMLSCESSNKIVKITDPIDCSPYEITYDKPFPIDSLMGSIGIEYQVTPGKKIINTRIFSILLYRNGTKDKLLDYLSVAKDSLSTSEIKILHTFLPLITDYIREAKVHQNSCATKIDTVATVNGFIRFGNANPYLKRLK